MLNKRADRDEDVFLPYSWEGVPGAGDVGDASVLASEARAGAAAATAAAAAVAVAEGAVAVAPAAVSAVPPVAPSSALTLDRAGVAVGPTVLRRAAVLGALEEEDEREGEFEREVDAEEGAPDERDFDTLSSLRLPLPLRLPSPL